METCRDCKYYQTPTRTDRVFRCWADNIEYMSIEKCSEFAPKQAEKVEDKTYTTGQMIDMWLRDNNLNFEMVSDVHNLGDVVGLVGGVLAWKECSFSISVDLLGDRWRIIKPTPKRTYKDVLLQRFPKADISDMCPCDIYGGKRYCDKPCDECWNSEYKEEEGAAE